MTDDMRRFVDVEQSYPEKRKAAQRVKDFQEIYNPFDALGGQEQASRCSQCGVPFCQTGCPLDNNIPDWLKLASEGRLEEAYDMASSTNMMPEICGRICPQDRLCEGSCVIRPGFNAVTIGAVEKFITETAWSENWVKPIVPLVERPQSVGIIGAGPGGLAAADRLRHLGYQVHIYDRYDRAGGMLVYGIPEFKLEKSVVARRVERLEQSGVVFHANFEVGRDATLDELRAKHASIVIATGTYKPRGVGLQGADLEGVHWAMDYLRTANQVVLGDTVAAYKDDTLNAHKKRVVVIGGGDTAMDCVRTALRQGARSVTCMYRRDRENMPGSVHEVQNAIEEGVEFMWNAAPEAFMGTGNNKISHVMAYKTRLGQADETGRRHPKRVDDSAFKLEADMVIKALGFEADDLPTLFNAPELGLSEWGTVEVDEAQMTSFPGVFAIGDIVRGPSLVVWAVHDGREVAKTIHNHIQSTTVTEAAE